MTKLEQEYCRDESKNELKKKKNVSVTNCEIRKVCKESINE